MSAKFVALGWDGWHAMVREVVGNDRAPVALELAHDDGKRIGSSMTRDAARELAQRLLAASEAVVDERRWTLAGQGPGNTPLIGGPELDEGERVEVCPTSDDLYGRVVALLCENRPEWQGWGRVLAEVVRKELGT